MKIKIVQSENSFLFCCKFTTIRKYIQKCVKEMPWVWGYDGNRRMGRGVQMQPIESLKSESPMLG